MHTAPEVRDFVVGCMHFFKTMDQDVVYCKQTTKNEAGCMENSV